MRIVALSDIHGDISCIRQISDDVSGADVVLLVGDLTNFGRQEAARQIIKAIQKYNDRIFAVPGNCDYPEVEMYLTDEGVNLDRKAIVIERTAFVGIGGSLPCLGKTPNEYNEGELKSFLEGAISNLDLDTSIILVAHQPPFNTVTDLAFNGQHVGSRSIRFFIEKFHPMICFSGHIHEARGIDSIAGTKVVNPGPFREGGYAYARISEKVEELEIRRFKS